MVRLSYRKLSNDSIVSNLIPLQTMSLYAFINAETLTYEIRSLVNGEVSIKRGGSGKNIQNIKDIVRANMIELGVVFKDEIRKKL